MIYLKLKEVNHVKKKKLFFNCNGNDYFRLFYNKGGLFRKYQ